MHQEPKSASSRNTDRKLIRLRDPLHRIGLNAERQIDWLLQFARTDLSQLTAIQLNQLQQEIYAFWSLGIWTLMERKTPEVIRKIAETTVPVEELQSLWKTKRIAKYQRITREVISTFLQNEWTTVPPVTINPQLLKTEKGVELRIMPLVQLDADAPFYFELLDLLRSVGSRLAICQAPDCVIKTFLMRRYKQEYCSNTCRSRVAMQKYRQQKREEKLKRKTKKKGESKNGKKRRS